MIKNKDIIKTCGGQKCYILSINPIEHFKKSHILTSEEKKNIEDF